MTLPLVASLPGLFLVGNPRVSGSSERRDFPPSSTGLTMPTRPPFLPACLLGLTCFGLWFGVLFVARVTARTEWMIACVAEIEPSAGHDSAVQLCAVQR